MKVALAYWASLGISKYSEIFDGDEQDEYLRIIDPLALLPVGSKVLFTDKETGKSVVLTIERWHLDADDNLLLLEVCLNGDTEVSPAELKAYLKKNWLSFDGIKKVLEL